MADALAEAALRQSAVGMAALKGSATSSGRVRPTCPPNGYRVDRRRELAPPLRQRVPPPAPASPVSRCVRRSLSRSSSCSRSLSIRSVMSGIASRRVAKRQGPLRRMKRIARSSGGSRFARLVKPVAQRRSGRGFRGHLTPVIRFRRTNRSSYLTSSNYKKYSQPIGRHCRMSR